MPLAVQGARLCPLQSQGTKYEGNLIINPSSDLFYQFWAMDTRCDKRSLYLRDHTHCNLFSQPRGLLKICLKNSDCTSISLLTTNGLFVGRFQPFHKGHLVTVKFALGRVDQLVIVVGSAQKSHEPRNPFTAGERIRMIKESLDADEEVDVRRILIIPVPDIDVHSLWAHQVGMLVPKYDIVFTNDLFTLMLFHEQGIKAIEAPLYRREEMRATEIRKRMVIEENWEDLVPKPVSKVIKEINGVERVKAISRRDIPGHII